MYNINTVIIEGKVKSLPVNRRFIIECKKNRNIAIPVSCMAREAQDEILKCFRVGADVRIWGWIADGTVITTRIEINRTNKRDPML